MPRRQDFLLGWPAWQTWPCLDPVVGIRNVLDLFFRWGFIARFTGVAYHPGGNCPVQDANVGDNLKDYEEHSSRCG